MSDSDTNETRERSEWWYAVPFLFGLIGGIIAYFMVKEDDKRMANQCVALGLVGTLIWGIILSIAWYVGYQSLIRGS